jgi:hypothetical protein
MTHSIPKNWRKSSYSQPTSGNCVEVADLPTGAAIRDTRHREAGHLEVPRREWAALMGAVRTGEL